MAVTGFSSCKKDQPAQGKTETTGTWMVTTIAGDGDTAFANGPVTSAKFHFPNDVAVAADGGLFVSDGDNRIIRKIANGMVSSFAGGDFGFMNGMGSFAQFKFPTSLAFDKQGNIFSADARDPRIRKINSAALVSTYAGTAEEGFEDGAAGSAQFRGENKIATDQAGNVYIADAQNNASARSLYPVSCLTLAGSGKQDLKTGPDICRIRFSEWNRCGSAEQYIMYPTDPIFASAKSHRRIVSTFAGKKKEGRRDGDTDIALFQFPTDMVVDGQGNLYVLDLSTVRKISPQGFVSTIAGSVDGYRDGEGTVAKFFTPYGLGIDAQGNIYVADTNNNRIRKMPRIVWRSSAECTNKR